MLINLNLFDKLKVNIYTMKIFYFSLFILSNISLGLCQNNNLQSSDYDEFYPQYFHAIEDATEGNFKEAIPAIEKMLSQFPNHQEAYLLLRICEDAINNEISLNAAEYFFEGMHERYNFAQMGAILFLFNQAFNEEDNYMPFYIIRGNYLAGLNNYDRALSDFSVAIQLEPNSAICFYNRGKLYFDNNYTILALSDFNKALEINPKYTTVYIKRAHIYGKMKEYSKILHDFKSAYAIDSTSIRSLENSSLLNNIATVFMGQNKLDTSLEFLNFSIKADKRWFEPFLNRGIVYKLKNQFDSAIMDLNKAIELKPQSGKAFYNRGLIYKDKRDFNKAKDDLIQSLAFEDIESNVFFTLAEVYKELKEYKNATSFYKEALKNEPENIWTYYQLASLYDKRRGFKEAVKYYDEFVKLASNEYFDHKIKAKDRSDRIKKYLEQQRKKK